MPEPYLSQFMKLQVHSKSNGFSLTPALSQLLLKNLHIERFEDEYVVTLFREQNLVHLFMKRLLDAALSLVILIILLPLMLVVAILIKQEVALVLVGGVFVVEALSVVMQVTYFKLTGGRRIFKCSPLHHHFQFKERIAAKAEGRPERMMETKITVRLCILSIIFALIGVAMLKIAMELKKADARPVDELIHGVLTRMRLDEGEFRRFLEANGGLLRAIAQKRYT